MNGTEKQFRGFIHIHTTYSYDGTFSLSDLRDLVKKRRYDFMLLTEHAEDFDDEKMQMLVDECRHASDEHFLVIPGLEFNIKDEIHLLGTGITKNFHERDPGILIQKIHENGGIAILAHTADYKKDIPYAQLKDVDFIEIWNPRYGERLSPSMKSIKILHEFRNMKTTFIASGGLDLHKPRDLVPVYQVVFSDGLNQKDIINSLKQGKFTTTNGFIELPSQNDPTPLMTSLMYLCAFIQFIPRIIIKTIVKVYKTSKRIFRS